MASASAVNNVKGNFEDRTTTAIADGRLRWNAGSFMSAVLGLIAGLGGLMIGLLTVSEIIVAGTSFYTSSTVLIGTSLILFGIAAHCLDKADAADRAIRLARCRRHGLNIE